MRSLFVALALLIGYGNSRAVETRWRPFHMELGCVSLEELYVVHPELRGFSTPESIAQELRKQFPNAKARPFIEILRDDSRVTGEPFGEPPKWATRSNAIFVSWGEKEAEDGVLMFTEDLCEMVNAGLVH